MLSSVLHIYLHDALPIFASALFDGGPGGSAHKESVVAEVLGILGLAVLALAHGHHVDDLHVLIGGGVGHHGVDDIGGLAAGVGHHDAVAGMDMLHSVLSGHEMFLIIGLPVHIIHSCSQFGMGYNGRFLQMKYSAPQIVPAD